MGQPGHLDARREFENDVLRALDAAEPDSESVGILVASVLGGTAIWHRRGPEAIDRMIDVVLETLLTVVPPGSVVSRIGDVDVAVLVDGGLDVVLQVRRDMNRRLSAPIALDGEQTQLALATAIMVGPDPAIANEDVFWCAASRAFASRAATQQVGITRGVVGEASTIDEAVRSLMVLGNHEFGLDGALVQIGERQWSFPDPTPERPPDHVFQLRTPWGRIGQWSSWKENVGAIHKPWLDEMFQCLALVLDGVLHVESSELRSRLDPLTGLLNRDGLAQAMRDIEPPYAVAMIDIDHFKQVNDRHGHEVGDRFLFDLGRLLSTGRSSDLVARWGGEELVVVMPGSDVEGAAVGLRRLLADAGRTIVAEGTSLSFSAGVAGVTDSRYVLADGIRAADDAMYEAKRNGRGRVVVADGASYLDARPPEIIINV